MTMKQTTKQEPKKTILNIWEWQKIKDELNSVKGFAGVLVEGCTEDVFTGDEVAGDFREMFKEIKVRCGKIESQVDDVFNELKSKNLLGRSEAA
jgi:hypothetical protein